MSLRNAGQSSKRLQGTGRRATVGMSVRLNVAGPPPLKFSSLMYGFEPDGGRSDDALQFAQTLSLAPFDRGPRTSISGAIDFGVRLLDESPVEPARRVIDVSSDGRNNKGRSVLDARAAAVSKGITINGLPVILGGSAEDIADMESYFRDCVIGGPGAFLIMIQEQNQFAEAIRLKIIREIAGKSPEPLAVPAHYRAPGNCDFPW
jgi:hypothetical protein